MNDYGFAWVRQLIHERAGIVVDESKRYFVISRLERIATSAGFGSPDQMLVHMRSHPDARIEARIVEAMTTNETRFFRDMAPFEAMRFRLIPELMKRHKSDQTLSIWCAACSFGQEPYSLAILLREHFPELSAWKLQIIASDISREVLARAREGRYSQIEVNRGLSATHLVRYFEKQGSVYRVRDFMRALVDFREINLNGPWPALPECDIIMMRNVLIYFDVATKQRLLEKVARQMFPGGYLFLGSSETVYGVTDKFDLVQADRAVCYQVATRGAGR